MGPVPIKTYAPRQTYQKKLQTPPCAPHALRLELWQQQQQEQNAKIQMQKEEEDRELKKLQKKEEAVSFAVQEAQRKKDLAAAALIAAEDQEKQQALVPPPGLSVKATKPLTGPGSGRRSLEAVLRKQEIKAEKRRLIREEEEAAGIFKPTEFKCPKCQRVFLLAKGLQKHLDSGTSKCVNKG